MQTTKTIVKQRRQSASQLLSLGTVMNWVN